MGFSGPATDAGGDATLGRNAVGGMALAGRIGPENGDGRLGGSATFVGTGGGVTNAEMGRFGLEAQIICPVRGP